MLTLFPKLCATNKGTPTTQEIAQVKLLSNPETSVERRSVPLIMTFKPSPTSVNTPCIPLYRLVACSDFQAKRLPKASIDSAETPKLTASSVKRCTSGRKRTTNPTSVGPNARAKRRVMSSKALVACNNSRSLPTRGDKLACKAGLKSDPTALTINDTAIRCQNCKRPLSANTGKISTTTVRITSTTIIVMRLFQRSA